MFCARARSSCRERRLVAGLVVVERLLRQQLPLETGCATARRWSAPAAGRLRAGGSSPATLPAPPRPASPARGFRSPRSSRCAGRGHAIAQPHGDVLQAAGRARRDRHRRLADQVADDPDLLKRSRRVSPWPARRSSGRARRRRRGIRRHPRSCRHHHRRVASTTAAAASTLSARSLRGRVVAAPAR